MCSRLGPGLPALRPRESRRGLWDHQRNLPTGQRRVCCCQVPQKPMWVTKPTVSFTQWLPSADFNDSYKPLMSCGLFETDGHFQKCMSMSGCEMVKQNSAINIKCCQKDFCNTFDWNISAGLIKQYNKNRVHVNQVTRLCIFDLRKIFPHSILFCAMLQKLFVSRWS